MNKLLLTETGQLLAAEPKKSNTRNLVRIRRIRGLTETVLCRARAFRLHFSWEYINVIKTIYKKWLIDNIIESIINRRSTLDVVYDNLKDGLTDKRNTRLSLIGIIFTILTSITVITGVTSFLVDKSGLVWGHCSRLIFIIASGLGVIAILLFALLRIRRE